MKFHQISINVNKFKKNSWNIFPEIIKPDVKTSFDYKQNRLNHNYNTMTENFINNKGYKLYARIGTSDDIYVLNDIEVNNNK